MHEKRMHPRGMKSAGKTGKTAGIKNAAQRKRTAAGESKSKGMAAVCRPRAKGQGCRQNNGICKRTERPDKGKEQSGVQSHAEADHLLWRSRSRGYPLLPPCEGDDRGQRSGDGHGHPDGPGIFVRHVRAGRDASRKSAHEHIYGEMQASRDKAVRDGEPV